MMKEEKRKIHFLLSVIAHIRKTDTMGTVNKDENLQRRDITMNKIYLDEWI